ncbi:T-complex protein 10 C-terminus-domain-containing protein [Chytriomyces sp. MP71]|nr:T-complex protein 10 C-terminus-domain-containing protein [Chytriomyces sp. MP71]
MNLLLAKQESRASWLTRIGILRQSLASESHLFALARHETHALTADWSLDASSASEDAQNRSDEDDGRDEGHGDNLDTSNGHLLRTRQLPEFSTQDNPNTVPQISQNNHNLQNNALPGHASNPSLLPRPVAKDASESLAHSLVNSLSKQLSECKLQYTSLISDNEQLVQRHAQAQMKITSLSESLRTLRREKESWEKSAKAAEVIPTKKEREQLDLLRLKIADLQTSLKRAEQRNAVAAERHKARVDELNKLNAELRLEIRVLEEERAAKNAASFAVAAVAAEASHSAVNTGPTAGTGRRKKNAQHRGSLSQPTLPSSEGSVTDHAPHEPAPPPPVWKTFHDRTQTHHSHPSLPPLTKQPPNASNYHSSPLAVAGAKTAAAALFTKRQAAAVKVQMLPSQRGLMAKRGGAQPFVQQASPPDPYEEDAHYASAREALDALQEKQGLSGPFKESRSASSGKLTREFVDERRVLSWYPNQTMKLRHQDSGATKVFFGNGDFKETNGGRSVYWYAAKQILHTTFEDGLQTVQFLETGQVEKHFVDGGREILFADRTVKYVYPNGEEESIFPDGTVQRVGVDGVRTVEFPDGTQEVHTG